MGPGSPEGSGSDPFLQVLLLFDGVRIFRVQMLWVGQPALFLMLDQNRSEPRPSCWWQISCSSVGRHDDEHRENPPEDPDVALLRKEFIF